MKKTRFIQFLCSLLIGVIFMLTVIVGLVIFDLARSNSSDLVFTTLGLEAEYDGTPLTNHQWELTQGALKDGHKVIADFTGSQTQAGESQNTMSVKIVDEEGNDVTGEYSIAYDFGSLKVNQRNFKLDAETDLDNMTPLNGKYILTSDQVDLLDGHYAIVSVTTTTSEIGLPVETIDQITIYDENDQVVTHNYHIYAREEGEPILIPGGGDGTGSISTSLSGDSVSGDNMTDGQPMFSVRSDVDATVYFRTQSCGDYLGSGWDTAPIFPALYDGTYAASYLTSFHLEKRNTPAHQMEIVSYIPDYPLPYFLATSGGNYDIQRNDAVNFGSIEQRYQVPFYNINFYSFGATKNDDAFENAYRNFVYEHYLSIDQETRVFMNSIIKAHGFSKNSPSIIAQVASYIQGAAVYNADYNRSLDIAPNNAIAFLSKYKEGVCRHYATAATLLYRALGIPARYTVGAMAGVKAGQWVDVMPDRAHAWVEVYINGVGWVPVEVTAPSDSGGEGGGGNGDTPCEDCGDSQCDGNCGGGEGGGAGGNEPGVPKKLELTPKTATRKYDGKTLYPDGQITGLEMLTSLGYQYSVSVSGSQTKVGISESIIENITIYDPRGNDVTDAFEITLKPGKLHVYLYVFSYYTKDEAKVYDGLSGRSRIWHRNQLQPGHSFSQIACTADPNVGVKENSVEVRIADQNGNDVTDQYLIQKEFGTLTITPAEITLKATDATKKYDGTPLTCQDYTLHKGQLVDGHSFDQVITSGCQIEIGRSENIIVSVRIVDAQGQDVTANYYIRLLPGNLKVTVS